MTDRWTLPAKLPNGWDAGEIVASQLASKIGAMRGQLKWYMEKSGMSDSQIKGELEQLDIIAADAWRTQIRKQVDSERD